MTDTPNLALPYILASQAQKHVTHNEAIRALDCLVQLSVESRDLTSPPATPVVEGTRYVVALGASGAWAGQSNNVAAFQDGAWAFYAPKDGWTAWVTSENILVVYAAGAWAPVPGGDGGGVTDHGMLTGLADDDHLQYLTSVRGDARYTPIDPPALGINTTADATNRLAVSSPASLFNHEGGGHQIKVNKNAATDTASLLFQTNFLGRAEMGLAGDDDFHFKVSPDGAAWFDSIRIDRATGKVSFPAMGASREVLAANRTYYVRTDGNDSNDGRSNTPGGAFQSIQKAWNVIVTLDLAGFTCTIQLADGIHTSPLDATVPPVGGAINISGNASHPENVVVSMTNKNAILIRCAAQVTVTSMEIRTGGVGSALAAWTPGAVLSLGGGVRFGACAQHHTHASNGGYITLVPSYSIVGGAQTHHHAERGGRILSGGGAHVTISEPVSFARFAEAVELGCIITAANSYSGAAVTGTRYSARLNGLINTMGGGANYFPGTVAGSASAGGQYA